MTTIKYFIASFTLILLFLSSEHVSCFKNNFDHLFVHKQMVGDAQDRHRFGEYHVFVSLPGSPSRRRLTHVSAIEPRPSQY